MSSTNTPNMGLIQPGVGTQQGPQYAQDINDDLNVIDLHDHSHGRGTAITPAGMNINTALTFANNFATDIAGLTLTAQLTTPAINTIYQSSNDLYFVDGLGNNVRITQSGGIAGSPGSIANLASPASASYVSIAQTFVWQSNTSVAADMDFGSAIMRNLSPNSTYALTLSPPTLTSNYTLVLPTIPASKKIVTIDASGNMAADTAVDGSSLINTSNVLSIGPLGISTAMLQAQSVTTAKIADGAITAAKFQNGVYPGYQSQVLTGTGVFTVPAGVNAITVFGCGGGGGGGGGQGQAASIGGAGGGGSGAPLGSVMLLTTPGQTYSYSVGAGGPGGAGGLGGSPGANGTVGGNTTFDAYIFYGGYPGDSGFSGGAGAAARTAAHTNGGAGGPATSTGFSAGGSGGANPLTAYTGISNTNQVGGTGGGSFAAGTGGGGGGSGPEGAGGAGGGTPQAPGQIGQSYGAGGGGGAGTGNTTGGTGGSGAAGRLFVTWVA